MVGDFSGYSQTDCNFNFNINVNVKVDSYMNRSFSFSFSQLLKDLLKFKIFKITKLKSVRIIMAQFEIIPQCLLFFSLIFHVNLRKKRDMRLIYFLIAFVYLLLTQWFVFPSMYIHQIKSLQSNSIFYN